MSWVATAIAGSALIGAGASIYASNKQSQAASNAANVQQQEFAAGQAQVQNAQAGINSAVTSGQKTLAPFVTAGTNMLQGFQDALPGLTATFNPTMQDLENTPGYKFALDQGLKATTNANSAMGLANSGVQGKGIANYAEGLASTTFQQQFQNYLQQQQQRYNMLYQPVQLGQGAALSSAQLGLSGAAASLGGAQSILSGGVQTGANVGNSLTNQGNAQAAGALGVAGAGSNALNQYMQWQLLQRLAPSNAPQVNNAAPAFMDSTGGIQSP